LARSSSRSRASARVQPTSPPSWSRGRRSEQAIVAVVLEAYVNGVSTRKVDRLVEQLGIPGMTKDRGLGALPSARGAGRGVPGAAARGHHPYPWLDAKQVKVRDDGHVRSKALVIAYAVGTRGQARGDRSRPGRGRVGSVLDAAAARPASPRPPGRPPLRLRSAPGAAQLDRAGARLPVAALRSISSAACTSTAVLLSAGSSGLRCARSSTPTRAQASEGVGEVITRLATTVPKVAALLEEAEEDLLASTPSPRRTGRSSAARTRSNGSTARSAAAPTSSASAPTTAQRSGSPARC
jgi:putative transposase